MYGLSLASVHLTLLRTVLDVESYHSFYFSLLPCIFMLLSWFCHIVAQVSLAHPRCCAVAHSSENRPQRVFPALCSHTDKHSSRQSCSRQCGYSEFVYLLHANALAVLFRLVLVHNLVWVFLRLYLREKLEICMSLVGSTHKDETKPVLVGQCVTTVGHCLSSTSS